MNNFLQKTVTHNSTCRYFYFCAPPMQGFCGRISFFEKAEAINPPINLWCSRGALDLEDCSNNKAVRCGDYWWRVRVATWQNPPWWRWKCQLPPVHGHIWFSNSDQSWRSPASSSMKMRVTVSRQSMTRCYMKRQTTDLSWKKLANRSTHVMSRDLHQELLGHWHILTPSQDHHSALRRKIWTSFSHISWHGVRPTMR